MRVLLLFRGAPGCGKSTFIREHGLEQFALSADDIRLKCFGPQMTVDGSYEISQKNDKTVWKQLYELLEIRMRHGEFTVIDATNSKAIEMNKYKDLAEHYKYRIFCIDMTDLPIEECKRRNMTRDSYKRVPESAIDKMYARFANQKIPSGITVIKPDELDKIWMKKFDMNKYEKIVHIGDIHGCYTALMEYFKNGFNDNYMYIFVGDILGSGIENAEVVKFMLSIYNKPNVLILEGEMDRVLWLYANGAHVKDNEFELVTRDSLVQANIDPKDIRKMYRRFGQCAWYTFNNQDYFVCHGGISSIPNNLTFLATGQLIYGVGSKDDDQTVANCFADKNPETIQIFGHRNSKNAPVKMAENVYNLYNSVEYGGNLRIAEVSADGINEIEIKNDTFRLPEEVEKAKEVIHSSVADTVINLRKNRYIIEKKFGNISAFNFSSKAFYDAVWNNQTIVARGLYINTKDMKVVARGFNKFFNINERPETRFEMLKHTLQFPVTCYVKENGYLGLVSYNSETDDLFITTKSNPEGDYAVWLREMIDNKMTPEAKETMKKICKDNNITLVFESVDMKNDPHIIEYPESKLFLLDAIANDINFSHWDYDKLVELSKVLGVDVKTKAFVIEDWADFAAWYGVVTDEDYEYEGRKIEGFVIEDSAGFMVKAKLNFYKYWKNLRSVAHITIKNGYIHDTGRLYDATSNEFYAFCQKLHDDNTPEQRELIPKDIVSLRKMFYDSKK